MKNIYPRDKIPIKMIAINAYVITLNFAGFPIGLVGMETELQGNIAFIDGQNLHLGTKIDGWAIDHYKFRTFLWHKYRITKAHYFLGYKSEKYQNLYDDLEKAGFLLNFKEHTDTLLSSKKGNVDSDVIFAAMKMLIDKMPFSKIYIVSGDGDYKKLIDYLIKKNRFGKILFPNLTFTSSLYKELDEKFIAFLNDKDSKKKIAYIK
jgi:hypothetical protein